MIDLLHKVSVITTIDRKALNKLAEKYEWCICDEIYTSAIEGNYRCFFDIGIGTIGIDYSSGDEVKYKFIPSKELEKEVLSTITNKKNPLVLKAEASLVKKITETYKTLF